MEEKIAIGIDVNGKEIEFDFYGGYLNCEYRNLVSLTVPEGVTHVWCHNNQLTELIIPEGVERVECEYNQITRLDMPDSVVWLDADKEAVGLEKYIGTGVDIELF